jgi:hypothetical protein
LTFADGTTQITAASGGSNYGNANVTAYTVTMGFTNYSNVNVAALITTNGLTNYSNVNVSALITTNGLTNFSNVNVKAYTESMGFQNYGNVNVAAYVTSMGVTNYSNVNASAYLSTATITTTGNITAVNGNIANIILTNNSIYSSQTAVDIQFGSLSATANIVMNRNVVHNRDLNVIGNVIANNISILSNITGNVNGYTIGYRDVPQITAANLTLITSDAGKHYYGSNTNPITLTIPTNANVAFNIGTAISIVNQGTGNITVANAAGVSLYLAGNSTVSNNRTITTYGMATLLKVNTNTWFINGAGVV